MFDAPIGLIIRLLMLVAIAVVIVQHLETIASILLAALLMLAILRLVWPLPRN